MSNSNADASEGVHGNALSPQDGDQDETVSRRTFMANATLTIGGVVGLVLAVPIVGSLIPPKNAAAGSWAPLSAQELDELQKATSKPVKLTFTLKYSDAYLPEQSADAVLLGHQGRSRKVPRRAARHFQSAGR